MRTPARGDLWLVNLAPALGPEQPVLRPVMVVSEKAFNRLGLCVVCPITKTDQPTRFAGFRVSLAGSGSLTQGFVLCNQPRTIDMVARSGRFVESVPAGDVIDEVLARVQPVFEL